MVPPFSIQAEDGEVSGEADPRPNLEADVASSYDFPDCRRIGVVSSMEVRLRAFNDPLASRG
jgi:hypothetical protein